jgi:allantoicase
LSELFIWIYAVADATLFDEGGAPAAKFSLKKRGDSSTDALVIRLSTKGKSRGVSIKVQNTTLI